MNIRKCLSILATCLMVASPSWGAASASPGNTLAQLGVSGVTSDVGTNPAQYANYLIKTGTNGLLATSILPPSVTPIVWHKMLYVDGVKGLDDSNFTGTVNSPYKTLTNAIAHGVDNTIYVLAPGTYAGITINAKSVTNITIMGQSPETTWINGILRFDNTNSVAVNLYALKVDQINQNQANKTLTVGLYNRTYLNGPITRTATNITSALTVYRDASSTILLGLPKVTTLDVLTDNATNMGYVALNTDLWWPAFTGTPPTSVGGALEKLAGRAYVVPGTATGQLSRWDGVKWNTIPAGTTNMVLYGGTNPAFAPQRLTFPTTNSLTTDFVPATNNMFSLGTLDMQWQYGWFGTDLYLRGTNLVDVITALIGVITIPPYAEVANVASNLTTVQSNAFYAAGTTVAAATNALKLGSLDATNYTTYGYTVTVYSNIISVITTDVERVTIIPSDGAEPPMGIYLGSSNTEFVLNGWHINPTYMAPSWSITNESNSAYLYERTGYGIAGVYVPAGLGDGYVTAAYYPEITTTNYQVITNTVWTTLRGALQSGTSYTNIVGLGSIVTNVNSAFVKSTGGTYTGPYWGLYSSDPIYGNNGMLMLENYFDFNVGINHIGFNSAGVTVGPGMSFWGDGSHLTNLPYVAQSGTSQVAVAVGLTQSNAFYLTGVKVVSSTNSDYAVQSGTSAMATAVSTAQSNVFAWVGATNNFAGSTNRFVVITVTNVIQEGTGTNKFSGAMECSAASMTNFPFSYVPYSIPYASSNMINPTNGNYQWYAPTSGTTNYLPYPAPTNVMYSIRLDVFPAAFTYLLWTNGVYFGTNEVMGSNFADIKFHANGTTTLILDKAMGTNVWRCFGL